MSESNLDILITRVIDERAAAQDWAELEALAAADPSVWRELAMAQRDDGALRAAVCAAGAGAGGVEVPVGMDVSAAAPARDYFEAAGHEAGVRERMRRVGMWSGWAAAAAVVLAVFAGRSPRQGTTLEQKPQVAGLALPDMLESYINQGKQQGTVIGELPQKVMLDSAKTADGRTEVTYIRQIVERVTVDDLYRMSVDEAGNAQPLKIEVRVVGGKSAT